MLTIWPGRRDARATRRHQQRRRRFAVEPLEGRQMLSTFTVTNTNDSGTGSLRWAITQVDNSTASSNTIHFGIGSGTQTIAPATALPTITRPVVIDGTTQPGYAGSPVIVLTGAANPIGFDGLTLAASGVTVKGLVINEFYHGVVIQSSKDAVEGCYIGTEPTGTGAINNYYGVFVTTGSVGNTIGGTSPGAGNLISGNLLQGISLDGAASGNVVEGNFIGTNAAGTGPLGNAVGVIVSGMGSANTIGGTTAGARNIISGNSASGIAIADPESGNLVEGNYIGTDVTGTAAVPNLQSGVQIQDGAAGNTIGGTTAAARNVISGNKFGGVSILGAGTTGNAVEGNFIGINAAGTGALPNLYFGVEIQAGASKNTVGGTVAGAADVISGNATLYIPTNGVIISDPGTSGNVVEGDFIGTDVSGLRALPNGGNGVQIQNGATNNIIGGRAAGVRDIISGNAASGVVITDPGTSGNVVEGDFIGTDVGGANALANAVDGVAIQGQAAHNTVGGTSVAAADVLSGNGSYGVLLFQSGTVGNVVEGDFIGTDPSGKRSVPNRQQGVCITGAASGNTVGGAVSGSRDLISGNAIDGVLIDGSDANVVEGDWIGTDVTGAASLSNGGSGVRLQDAAQSNTIGGTAGSLTADLISGNSASGAYSNGILITGAGTTGNVVEGDFIGTDPTGKIALPNGGNGVQIQGGATGNTVGGTVAAARDLLSGNAYSGVLLTGTGTTGNVVEGDFIGTDPSGKVAIPNDYGVAITAGASGNTVGGTTAAARDLLSGNNGFGAFITGLGTSGNTIEGDRIGTDVTGAAAVPLPSPPAPPGGASITSYQACGVLINGQATGNAVVRDVISGNNDCGVEISDAGTEGNVVAGDDIGTVAAGTSALANGTYGVAIVAWASGNTVGGTVVAARDVISGNGLAGVFVNGAGTRGNVVEGDFIGTDVSGTVALDDSTYDVVVNGGATYNTIGGTTAAARDLISGNAAYRVVLSDVGTTSNDVEGDYIGTNAAGNAILGTGVYGAWITNGASNNFVGAPTASGADVIDGNTGAGVALTGPGTDNNVVAEDKIGVNAADNAALGNQVGVLLSAGASINLVDGCVISGNVIGVDITDAGTTGNAVEFDLIGTDATRKIGLGNTQYGIVLNGTSANFLGYDTIANSGLYGILLIGSGDEINAATITFSNNKDGSELTK